MKATIESRSIVVVGPPSGRQHATVSCKVVGTYRLPGGCEHILAERRFPREG